MDAPLPPLAPRPDLEPAPRTSWLAAFLVGTGLLTLFGLLAVFASGVFFLGFGLVLLIGLQYLVWGWWFERIYRSGPIAEGEPSDKRDVSI
ncbi:MAG: hypothetical protein WD872_12165 [Pirellulaceae bacterium]